jgi:RNA polymerase sigma factor (sigma-70 family)
MLAQHPNVSQAPGAPSLAQSALDSGLDALDLDALMARHEGLVHAVLRRQWGGTLSYDERLQAGRLGLWHALQGFDPDRGAAFSTYAGVAIQRDIWHAVRQAEVAARPIRADLTTEHPDEPDAALLQAETLWTLHALVDQLPPRLRQVVVAYYGLGAEPPRTLRQLGALLGLSHEAVRLRLWAALVWLRHPAHSLALRRLLECNTLADHQLADGLAQAWLRRRGGRR